MNILFRCPEGLKGNPVRDGSGPAAVILIPQVRNKSLYRKCHFPEVSGWEGR